MIGSAIQNITEVAILDLSILVSREMKILVLKSRAPHRGPGKTSYLASFFSGATPFQY